MKKLFILQSGFLGSNEKTLSRPDKHNDVIINDILAKDYISDNNINFYSNNISTLHKMLLAEPKVINTFEFREKILAEAYINFDVNLITKWLMLQNQSSKLTPSHIEFIYDTLNYISGHNRKLDVNQWYKLVSLSTISKELTIDYKKYFDSGNGTGIYPEQYSDRNTLSSLNANIVDFISTWVSRNNGFTDLLVSLNVIFGIRISASNVSEKYE